jgi:hypothetical protein
MAIANRAQMSKRSRASFGFTVNRYYVLFSSRLVYRPRLAQWNVEVIVGAISF